MGVFWDVSQEEFDWESSEKKLKVDGIDNHQVWKNLPAACCRSSFKTRRRRVRDGQLQRAGR